MSTPRPRYSRLWRSLTLQLFLLILLPLTLLLLLVAVGGSLLHQRAMRDLVGERDQRAARAAAAAIDEQLQQRASAIHNLARTAGSVPDPAAELQNLAPLLPEFSGGWALFDAEGQRLAAIGSALPPSALPPPVAASEEVLFHFLPASGASDPGGNLVVSATVDGVTATGAFSVTELARRALARVFPATGSGSAFLVAPDGTVVYRTGSPLGSGATLLDHPAVVSALRGESGATYFAAEHGEVVAAFSPITPLGWALVVEEPWQAVADPLLHTTEWAPLVLVPVLIIALLGLAFGARQVVQPLQSLEEKATALAWGDFESIEESVGGIAEIQRLQNELIRMARKVQAAQQSLRGYLGAVTAGQEDERRRLARELHDDAIQSLIALNQRIQLAQLVAQESPAPEPARQLQEMQEMVSELIAGLRRQIHALRPIYLEDLGLLPALQMLAREVQAREAQGRGTPEGHSLSVTFQSEGPERRLPPAVELALYRITQEALNNVARHAAATQADITLSFKADGVGLTVRDDGRGFAVPETPAELAPRGHFGLLGIHERAELIGARLRLQSKPGGGTRLHVDVPAPSGEVLPAGGST